jgi:probable biosynthetic protein (TIGR04099 family)
MNIHADTMPDRQTEKTVLIERALSPHMLIGMPHLTPFGLSETWLMKELGHRHWLLLGKFLGLEDADFRSPAGEELYAAFCASSMQQARLERVKANDVLTIRSDLVPVSRNQIASQHLLFLESENIGDIEFVSTFVLRERDGDNRSIVRSPMAPVVSRFAANGWSSELATTAAMIRKGQKSEHMRFDLQSAQVLKRFQFTPVVSQEFNGASLFYCAEFQAVHDRAMADWGLGSDAGKLIARRDVFFLGNANKDEKIIFELKHLGKYYNRTYCLVKGADHRPLAMIFSKTRSRV